MNAKYLFDEEIIKIRYERKQNLYQALKKYG